MTVKRDPDAILAAWLEDGPDRLPVATKRAIAVTIRSTHQSRRPRWMPWRSPTMNGMSRLALGVVAVLAVALGGLYLFNQGRQGGIGGPGPIPSPSPSPAPLTEGPLAPGRYAYDGDGVRVTVTVPAGWEGGSFYVAKAPARELPDGASLGFRQPTGVFPDPCAPESGARQIGPSVDDLATDDLVTALVGLPNVTASPPADVTVSGFSAKRVNFVVDTEGISCVMGLYGQGGFVRAADNGQHQDLWILDVAGTRLVIDAATYPETSADVRVELQAMVDTILIERID